MPRIALGACALTLVLVSACGGTTATAPPGATAPGGVAGTPVCATGTLTASGSTALQPLAQKAATAYQARCAGSIITVSGGGSSVGLNNAAAGLSDIGDSDVPVSDAPALNAATVTDHQVAIAVFAVVVNPQTKVTNLTAQQIRDIFSGRITNWHDVGGANLAVTLIERKPGSGTRLAFDKDIMNGIPESASPASAQDSTQLVVSGVAGAPGAVSYINVASVAGAIVPVSIDGARAGGDAVKSGAYPLFSHEHMYTRGSGSTLAESFIKYILSAPVQSGMVTALGYLPISVTDRQSAADR